MLTLPRAKPITAEEFETFDPDWRYDLIAGELIAMPPMPGGKHGRIAGVFTVKSGNFILDNRLGEVFAAETRFLIQRSPDTAIAPDWAFVQTARLPDPLPDSFMPLVPDAILEVRSPSDRESEVVAKMQRWMAAGVRLGWELNPRTQTTTVYRPGQLPQEIDINGTISGEDVLPGFTLPMRQLFPQQTEPENS